MLGQRLKVAAAGTEEELLTRLRANPEEVMSLLTDRCGQACSASWVAAVPPPPTHHLFVDVAEELGVVAGFLAFGVDSGGGVQEAVLVNRW